MVTSGSSPTPVMSKIFVIRTGIKPGSGIYFDSNGKSVVGSDPRFKRAFELAKTVRDEGLDADIGAWSNEWGEALRRGDVATQMMGAIRWSPEELVGPGHCGQLEKHHSSRGC